MYPIGLDSVPDGVKEILDVAEESAPSYLRAKKKLEEYMPFETQLVSCVCVCVCVGGGGGGGGRVRREEMGEGCSQIIPNSVQCEKY